jgi:ABC-type nickel/cobalt efflux system permease component RcnA
MLGSRLAFRVPGLRLMELLLAFILGLRHASDPDHLVAVTSLVAADDGDLRGAARLGAWWGLGHALTLLAVGLPLIALKEEMPEWLSSGAETGVGLVIVALGARLLVNGLRRQTGARRTPHQSFGIGTLHGLAGSGAVVVLLIAAVPDRLQAAAALAVFAPATMLSMTAFTGAFAWVLGRSAYRAALVPALGAFGLLFGLWYAGIT